MLICLIFLRGTFRSGTFGVSVVVVVVLNSCPVVVFVDVLLEYYWFSILGFCIVVLLLFQLAGVIDQRISCLFVMYIVLKALGMTIRFVAFERTF